LASSLDIVAKEKNAKLNIKLLPEECYPPGRYALALINELEKK